MKENKTIVPFLSKISELKTFAVSGFDLFQLLKAGTSMPDRYLKAVEKKVQLLET